MLLTQICSLTRRYTVFASHLVRNRYFSIYTDTLPQALKSGALTYYDVLQIPYNAKTKEIKQAYLRLVKIHHPDASIKPCSQDVFICIKEAHDVLSDPGKRREYDRGLATTRSDQGVTPLRKPLSSRGVGYQYSAVEDTERFERYRRYVNGERIDRDEDRYQTSKTLLAIAVSFATILGVTIFAEEFFNRFKNVGTEDDDYVIHQGHDRKVKAYYNPVTENWERVIDPFIPPPLKAFIDHYLELDEDWEESELQRMLPRREFVILELPFNRTHRPTLLWDARSSQLVVFRE